MRIGFAPADENEVIDQLEAGLAEGVEDEDEDEDTEPRAYFALRFGTFLMEWRIR